MHAVCVRTFSKVEIADTEYTKHNACQLMKAALEHTPKICHLKIRSTTKFVFEMKHGCMCYVHQRILIYKLAASVSWINTEINTAIFMWFNFKYLNSFRISHDDVHTLLAVRLLVVNVECHSINSHAVPTDGQNNWFSNGKVTGSIENVKNSNNHEHISRSFIMHYQSKKNQLIHQILKKCFFFTFLWPQKVNSFLKLPQ